MVAPLVAPMGKTCLMDHTARANWLLATQPPSSDVPNEHGNDTFEWMHARGALWPLSHVPSTTIAFAPDHDPMLRHGLWQAVIDLLMYGNGWANLAGEMRSWRKSGYRQSNDVLAFVYHNFHELLLPLETYFAVYGNANSQIALYLLWNEDHREVEKMLSPRPAANTDALIQKCKELNLESSSTAFELVNALPRSANGDTDSDPLHISPHFTFEWTSAEFEIGPKDKVSKVADDLGTVMFDSYGHWYRKAHMLTDEWWNELMAKAKFTDDLDYRMHIDVHIRGIGFLGRFARVGPGGRLCRVAPTDISFTVERDLQMNTKTVASARSAKTISPTIGIPISSEMHECLVKARSNPQHKSSPEKLEVLTREEVELAFALVWHSPDEENSWCRVDGEWVPGWITIEGKQADECLLEMVKQKQLDVTVPVAQAMFDDARCLDEIKPWAAMKLLELWDSVSRIPEIIAELAQMESEQEVTQHDFLSEQLVQMGRIFDEAYSRRMSDVPMAEVVDLRDFLRDSELSMQVRYLLETIIMLCKDEGWPSDAA